MSLDTLSVNTIRVLAADMVDKCGSGHPGMPMGMAALAHVLFSQNLAFSAQNPHWYNRDRFLLSNGHGCVLQYIMLHLSQYPEMTMDQLKKLRTLGSLTPGHPEARHTAGVEVTTGPLGQGIANGVGLAWASGHLAAVYNKEGFDLFNNFTYVFCGDGCLQEGVSGEASSLAGTWKTPRLIVVYDDNKITIDGKTSISFTEDVAKRYEAYGWQVLHVDNADSDVEAIKATFAKARELSQNGPVLIDCKTTIGFGSGKQGTEKVHGEALGAADVKIVKEHLGFKPDESFVVPEDVYSLYKKAAAAGADKEKQWDALFAQYKEKYPKEAAEITTRFNGELPPLEALVDKFPHYSPKDKAEATRSTSGTVLNVVAEQIPALVGGSADLTTSNKTALKCSTNYSASNHAGRQIHFGIREHGMMAISNGIYAYGGFIPFSATFLNFLEYGFPSARLAALSEFQQIYIMTHDSIGLGEDGPTHQPIEALALCRATPNFVVYRPADGQETIGAYVYALYKHARGPSIFALSRQNLPNLEGSSWEKALKGAYSLWQSDKSDKKPNLVFISTGSEVPLALEAAKKLASDSFVVRVVSCPSDTVFRAQPVDYRLSVLPAGVPVVAVEALSAYGWSHFSHIQFCMNSFGASGDYLEVYKLFGFTAENIANKAKEYVESVKKQAAALGHQDDFPVLPVQLDAPHWGPTRHAENIQ